jgi:hypothetical protein
VFASAVGSFLRAAFPITPLHSTRAVCHADQLFYKLPFKHASTRGIGGFFILCRREREDCRCEMRILLKVKGKLMDFFQVGKERFGNIYEWK